MSQTNPYEVPVSNLDQPSTVSSQPLNPNWDIGNVLSEAWALTSGFKATFWGAFFLYFGIIFAVSFVGGLITAGTALLSSSIYITVLILVQVVQLFIAAPLVVGLLMIGIRRAAGLPVNAFMVFNYFPKTLPLFFAYLLLILLVVLGTVLLVLPGIYLMLAYAFALPLLADKNLGIWQSLETSRKGITPCWFRFLGFGLIASVISILSALPLLIGLVWVMPWLYIAVGIIYRDLFGVSSN